MILPIHRLLFLGSILMLVGFPCSQCVFAQQSKSPPTTLSMKVQGSGPINVLFICGNGADRSVWTELEKKVRKLGVQTIVYDRNGIGKSKLWKGGYSIQKEVDHLKTALRVHSVKGPILLVPHSYGGLIAAMFSAKNPEVKGVVLVDAVLPEELSKEVVDGILEKYRPQYELVRKRAPKLATAIIPLVEAYPETAKTTQKFPFSKNLPIVDIRAEIPAVASKEEEVHSKEVHKKFVAASKSRRSVFAEKSGHQVMKDRPELIFDEIDKMVRRLKLEKSFQGEKENNKR